MTIVINLKPEIETIAAAQAEEGGLPLAEYVESVVKESILKRQRVKKLSEKSFDEILKPFRAEVESSGISENELEDLFKTARREVSKQRKIRE